MLLYEFNEDLTGGFGAGSIGLGGANRNVKFDTCPRTSAVVCECSKVMQLSESLEKVIAQCIISESNGVQGHVLFIQQTGTATLIKGVVNGLTPGKHGFHIHEFGDLSNGCESTGGHYNPHNVEHGDIDEGHVGDLGNITADENGVARFTIVASRIELLGEFSIVGRAVVIHANEDNTQAGGDDAGNSGERVAAGVIALRDTGGDSITESTITSADISSLDTFADKVFSKVGIDVEFTNHFMDRVNDARNNKQITMGELTRLFKQEARKWGKPIAQLGPNAEAVMKDLKTDVNVPFILRWDKQNQEMDLIAKTVMRKADFATDDREFPIESINEALDTPYKFEYNYDSNWVRRGDNLTPRQRETRGALKP